MSDFLREEFKERIKNNEYNNISIRIINESRNEGLKKLVDHNQKWNKNISINIPYSHNNNYNYHNEIPSPGLRTNPNNSLQNNLIIGLRKNALINKISASNLQKISKKLKELKHFGSSSDVKRGGNKSNHIIYISKTKDSTIQNLKQNNNETNVNYTQIKPVNKLSSHLTSKTNFLNQRMKQPERRRSSLISQTNNHSIHNINITNNYIYDSNIYKNPIGNKPITKNYYESMTYDIKNNNNTDNNNNDYIDNNLTKRNVTNNKIYFNNSLFTINEIKKGNLLLHKLNKKDLLNMKNNKMVTSNSVKGEAFYNSLTDKKLSIKNKAKVHHIKYISKDSNFLTINPKFKLSINQLKHLKDSKSFQNLLRISNSSKSNTINNIKTSDNNIKNIQNQENNKINDDFIPIMNYQRYIRNARIRNYNDKTKPFLNNSNIKEIINRSMDHKNNRRSRIKFGNKNFHVIKNLSAEKKMKDEVKDNKELDYERISEEEDSKLDSNSEQEKNDNININNNQFRKKFLNKNLISKNKKEKNLLKHIKEVETNNNIDNIDNSPENKKDQFTIARKNSFRLTEDNDLKPQFTKKIKTVIMEKNPNDIFQEKSNISLTQKKDIKQLFNTEAKEENSKNEINTKHINYKGIKYRLVNSLSVKDQLRKYISDRNKTFDKFNKKFQFNDEDENSMSNYTHTAKKDKILNNYTYLELKDIKNIKRDNFITLHSVGGLKDGSRFDEFDSSSTFADLKYKIFKPYVSTHPSKKFKKRGLISSRVKSARKISGIKIVGNSGIIEYQFDRINLSALKNSPFLGKSMRNIIHGNNKDKIKTNNNE